VLTSLPRLSADAVVAAVCARGALPRLQRLVLPAPATRRDARRVRKRRADLIVEREGFEGGDDDEDDDEDQDSDSDDDHRHDGDDVNATAAAAADDDDDDIVVDGAEAGGNSGNGGSGHRTGYGSSPARLDPSSGAELDASAVATMQVGDGVQIVDGYFSAENSPVAAPGNRRGGSRVLNTTTNVAEPARPAAAKSGVSAALSKNCAQQ
jgi:hypothetical protein